MQITSAIMKDKEEDSFLATQAMYPSRDAHPSVHHLMQTAVMPKRGPCGWSVSKHNVSIKFSLLEIILENNRLKEGNGLKTNEWVGLVQKNECCNSKNQEDRNIGSSERDMEIFSKCVNDDLGEYESPQ